MRVKKFRFLFAALFIVSLSSNVIAEQIVQALPGGLHAVANYHKGEPDKATIFFLHGFLTTHNFNTIRSATEMLAENGYTVLAPTLTLGINKRAGGLACNAIHTTTVQHDVNEVKFWVNWLTDNGHDNIVLLGHSQGSIELLAYALQKPPKSVKKIVAASLSYIDAYIDPGKLEEQIIRAKSSLKKNDMSPQRYSLTYCRGDFLSPPDVYLSYIAWDKSRVHAAINNSPIPVSVIMGGKDRFFAGDWQTSLQQTRANVYVIDEASHFFDGDTEFDFHDLLLELVSADNK